MAGIIKIYHIELDISLIFVPVLEQLVIGNGTQVRILEVITV